MATKNLLFLAVSLIAQASITSAALADDFFGDKASAREQAYLSEQIAGLNDLENQLGLMKRMLQYQAFSEGRCSDFVDVEEEAKQSPEAQHMLSDLYRRGICVGKDDQRSLAWARKAGDAGYAPAIFDVGYFFLNGIGTNRDPAEAARWFDRAKDKVPAANYHLASIYFDGEGVPKNYEKSHSYALKGAQFGDAPSQAMLVLLESLVAYPFYDKVSAYKWALIANASGEKSIVHALEKSTEALQSSLTPAQISRAQSEAARWVHKKVKSEDPLHKISRKAESLPTVDPASVKDLSVQKAGERLIKLGLEKDRFLFFKAIAEDNLGVTALYIQAGASPNAINPVYENTPLLHAARNGSIRVAKYLVSRGADVDGAVNQDGDTPILLAMSEQNRELVEFLIAKGAKLNHPGIMYNAVGFDDPVLLARLVAKGVPIDLNYVGTPLNHAVAFLGSDNKTHCLEKSAAFLLEHNARVEAKDATRETPLQSAIQSENPIACVRMLLEQGATQTVNEGGAPLLLAVNGGESEVVDLLLSHGGNPNLTFNLKAETVPGNLGEESRSTVMNGGSLLHLAVAEHHISVVKVLVRHGANKDYRDGLGRTPLSMARAKGDQVLVDVLNQSY